MPMEELITRIQQYAGEQPHVLALQDQGQSLSYHGLDRAIQHTAAHMTGQRIGLLLDNGVPWCVCDLAVHRRGAVCVPLPLFFTNDQLRHAINDAGLDQLITDRPQRAQALVPCTSNRMIKVAGRSLWSLDIRPRKDVILPAATAKITYTSGTTGTPRGVCLDAESLLKVTASLCDAVNAHSGDRSLSVLPLSTLLENIAGVYAPLWAGGLACVPSLDGGDDHGATGMDVEQFMERLVRLQPSSTVLVPALLKLLVAAIEAGAPRPATLRFIAVGGAPVSTASLDRARAMGLPVFQGYGLSEAASVVSLNLPGCERAGSVGRPLPHAGVHIAQDGEILVRGTLAQGYVGQDVAMQPEISTGDLGYLDDAGFLHITGRKKTVFATAYGRNVSPEWVETELTSHDAVLQATVFGSGQPFLVAVLVAHPRHLSGITAAVANSNRRLPEYARVRRWVITTEPFSVANGLARGSGTIDRSAVGNHFRTEIETLYEERHVSQVL